jgi:hypothetical protein
MVNLRNYLVTGLAAIALAGEGFDVTARAAEGKEEVTYQDYKKKKMIVTGQLEEQMALA